MIKQAGLLIYLHSFIIVKFSVHKTVVVVVVARTHSTVQK